MKKNLRSILVLSSALVAAPAFATEFQKPGKAISTFLGSTKATKRTVKVDGKDADVYSVKDQKPVLKYAFIQKGIYAPNCTHTWMIGIDAKKNTVSDIQVIEMSCPHAFPTREKSFLSQYTGKGPADVAKLSSTVVAVAKATGSADLTTDAVKRSIKGASDLKGK